MIKRKLSLIVLVSTLVSTGAATGIITKAGTRPTATTDDLIFIHHSCGSNWLGNSLHGALLAKDYIDERNDITYGTVIAPDAGRPSSLGGTPGNNTNMNHWIRWFNDYVMGVRAHGAASGANRIIMFKSCYPISNVTSDGTEPGDPFSSAQTLTNYRAVYRHPDGPGNTYSDGGYTYYPLEDIFAANPDTLFIPVTAPPLHYAPSDATTDANAHRARVFNDWLKNDWLDGYNAAYPGLNNVAVFDWFDVLAYADTHGSHPNRLRDEYGGASGNSHPNSTANAYSTQVFATNPDNFIDAAWDAFVNGGVASLEASRVAAYPLMPGAGDTISYTIVLSNPGTILPGVNVTSTLSPDVHPLDNLWASAGDYGQAGGTVTWTGSILSGIPVTVTFGVTVGQQITLPTPITNTVLIDDGQSTLWRRSATVIANGHGTYLPLVMRGR